MRHARRKDASLTDTLFKTRPRKTIPHAFVLDALEPAAFETRPMFGSLAIYVREKIVMILRDRKHDADNGVWLATTEAHHRSLRREFPSMRSISAFGEKVTGWQVLPADADDFEDAALHACELVVKGDPRIGKVPKPRPSRATKTVTRRRQTG
jgi:hypothetical protein